MLASARRLEPWPALSCGFLRRCRGGNGGGSDGYSWGGGAPFGAAQEMWLYQLLCALCLAQAAHFLVKECITGPAALPPMQPSLHLS